MVCSDMAFEEFLEILEGRGWVLQTIWKPYRVFVKEGEPLPFLAMVQDGKVSGEYVKKFLQIEEGDSG